MKTLLVLLAVLASGCGNSISYSEHDNLTYRVSPGSAGKFDMYQPPYDAGRARPAVLAIHGGAWSTGDKDWGRKIADQLCPSGFVVIAINYRLAPEFVWPAQLEDCQEAVRYVRSHAGELGIDGDRIATVGISAGGQLASMLALRDDVAAVRSGWERVRASVTLEGESDLSAPLAMSFQPEILLTLFGHVPSKAELDDASPIRFVRHDAALLIVHAVGDTNVYYTQGAVLSEALLRMNADTQLISVSGSAHGDVIFDDDMIRATRDFLSIRLGPQPGGVSASAGRQISSALSNF